MDYRKLDAPLAAAVSEAADLTARALSVFVHLARPPSPPEQAALSRLGVACGPGGPSGAGGAGGPGSRQIFTATLSADQVSHLSEQAWVRQLRLSQRLDIGPPRPEPFGRR